MDFGDWANLFFTRVGLSSATVFSIIGLGRRFRMGLSVRSSTVDSNLVTSKDSSSSELTSVSSFVNGSKSLSSDELDSILFFVDLAVFLSSSSESDRSTTGDAFVSCFGNGLLKNNYLFYTCSAYSLTFVCLQVRRQPACHLSLQLASHCSVD